MGFSPRQGRGINETLWRSFDSFFSAGCNGRLSSAAQVVVLDNFYQLQAV